MVAFEKKEKQKTKQTKKHQTTLEKGFQSCHIINFKCLVFNKKSKGIERSRNM